MDPVSVRGVNQDPVFRYYRTGMESREKFFEKFHSFFLFVMSEAVPRNNVKICVFEVVGTLAIPVPSQQCQPLRFRDGAFTSGPPLVISNSDAAFFLVVKKSCVTFSRHQ